MMTNNTSSYKLNISADQFRMTPRKKFNMLAEVKRNVCKMRNQVYGSGWLLVPNSRIVSRISYDFTSSLLYQRGMQKVPDLIDWSLEDVLKYITILPCPSVKENKTGKGVKGTPVFYGMTGLLKSSRSEYVEDGFKPSDYKDFTLEMLIDGYHACEKRHKSLEDHHPDGAGWLGGLEKSMEVVLDIYSSLLRSYNVSTSYQRLLNILGSEKFRNLDSSGVYFALLHLIIRGVSNSLVFRESAKWRAASQPELMYRHKLFLQSVNFTGPIGIHPILESYYKETRIHMKSVESELQVLRFGGRHDQTKFEHRMIFFYTWYWGVYQNFSETNRHRLATGIHTTIEEFMEGKETMFSLGKSFGDGIAASEGTKEVLGSVESLIKNAMEEATTSATATLQETLERETEKVSAEAKSLLDEMSSRASSISEESISRATSLVDKLANSLDSIVSVLSSLSSCASSLLEKSVSIFRSFPGMKDLKVSASSIMAAIRDYILYLNTDSKILKTLLVMSIMNNLGILKIGLSYLEKLWEYVRPAQADVDGESTDAFETAGIFSFMASSINNLVYVIAGLFASICKGSVLPLNSFWSLVKYIVPCMRDIHFLGAGCLGIERIFGFIQKLYLYVSKWIQENIFGVKDNVKEFSRRIVLWSTKVNYFVTEAGLNAIRLNTRMREIATGLHPEYQALIAEARTVTDYRKFIRDIEGNRKNVQTIYDFIVRLEAVSNFTPTMFHIQFVGQPGVGKSFLTKTFCKNVLKALYPDENTDSVYSYNPNLEYFDGYSGQKIFLIDDCFRMQEPKHLTTLIGLVTNTPVILPMANLSDKGTQLQSDILISSTNTAYPIGKDVLCMEAVHRRRHMLVEVVIDEDVRDPSTGQFCKTSYLKKYKEEDLPKYPHLKFNLLRPVPRELSGAASVVKEGTNEFDELQKYANILKDANVKIMTPRSSSIEPTFYFSDDNRPPEPLQLPCVGWTYEQLVHNFAARYCAFRGHEQTFSLQRKYAHAERAITEIEALFAQADDISEAPEFPTDSERGLGKFRLIEKWFGEVHHPYAASDPIGERLLSDSGIDLAPELEEVDFDSVIGEIFEQRVETSLSLQEELERTRRIRDRSSRLRAKQPEALANRLQVIQMETDDPDVVRSLIPLLPHATTWEGWGLPREPMRFQTFGRVWDKIQMEAVYNEILTSHGKSTGVFGKEKWAWLNEMEKFCFGAMAYYTKSDIFPEEIRGKKSSMPLYFLKNLVYIHGNWHLDISKLAKIPLSDGSEIRVRANGETYTIPIDAAFMFSICEAFRVFVLDFDALTTEQQGALVYDAQWRNQFTGLYTIESIRRTCTNILSKASLYALECLFSPIHYICHQMPLVVHWVASVSIFFAVIWMLKQFASLFRGKEKTLKGDLSSKYLHRGPQSNIVYHGRVTASAGCVRNFSMNCESVLKSNVREVTFTSDTWGGCTAQALMSEKYLFFNKHAIRGIEDKFIYVSIKNPGSEEELKFIVPRQNFVVREDADLAVCTYRSFPMVPLIKSKLLTDEEYETQEFMSEFILLSRHNSNPLIEYHPFSRKAIRPRLRTQEGVESVLDRALIISGNTVVGKSGSTVMYLTTQNQPRIVGIQAWAIGLEINPQIAVQVLTQELYQQMVDDIDKITGTPVRRESSYPVTICEDLPAVFTSHEFNNVVLELPDEERAGVIGKTQFKTTTIARFMDEDGFSSKRCPAVLNSKDPRLQSPQHPMAHSVGKYFRGTLDPFDPQLLRLVKKSTISWINGKLDRNVFRSLSPHEIITGTREDGSNPMNLTSSPGIPFIFEKRIGKGKTDYFKISEEGDVEKFDETIYEEYEHFLSKLKKRQIPLTRAYDFPKDELRPVLKALGSDTTPPKTRTVTCMNMFYIMAWREVTLDFWAAMHRAADGTFPFCPGINPEGPDWSNAFYYLDQHPNVVDFDVSNWDGFLPAELFYLAGEIISECAHLSQEERNVVESILTDVMNCFIQYDKWIYLKHRGMVSGFPGTAEMNSLVHWLLIIYIYLVLSWQYKQFNSVEAMRAHVSFLVYGDDIIISFSDEVKTFFNGLTIADMYTRIGYPVTSADKTGVIQASKDIFFCSFLKSSWSHLEAGIYIRKMDMEVARDLLYWVRARNDPVEQFMLNVVDSLRIVFGHGELAFDDFVDHLNRWLRKAGLDPVLYSYEDLKRDHFERYYCISY